MQLMKNMALAICLLSAVSCKKSGQNPQPDSPPSKHPPMTYIDLAGKTIAFGQSTRIDLDNNGKTDLLFRTEQVSYELNQKVKNVYLVESGIYCNLAVNLDDETTPHLIKGETITLNNFSKYEWYNVLSLTLMQKVFAAGETYWEGPWKYQDHEYLPLQVVSDGKVYLGWIEIGGDAQHEKLVLYKAALCQQPNVPVRAGM